ncbi:phytanoyl-CoA dioxygenase family protein [Niveispirillum sp. KHB5.9]|uniref:phytanoyl-CoA dioxygenase family protein n=1 Tax=Niveispirillum sp. KHB5.9 TaxID=3400269 RepID=UPI003A860953
MALTGIPAEGALHVPRLIDVPALDALRTALAPVSLDRPGLRLRGVEPLHDLLGPQGRVGRLAADLIRPGAMPVRALLFDKSAARNWTVGWHQDRVIAVRERRDVPGFGPWSVKDGIHHVAPPVSVLAGMVTIRLHLDPVDEGNAPLLYAPGSHRLGMVPEREVAQAVARCGTATSLAAAGDAWAYATLILHASAPAVQTGRRRVLHVDYAAAALPGGLEWLGI